MSKLHWQKLQLLQFHEHAGLKVSLTAIQPTIWTGIARPLKYKMCQHPIKRPDGRPEICHSNPSALINDTACSTNTLCSVVFFLHFVDVTFKQPRKAKYWINTTCDRNIRNTDIAPRQHVNKLAAKLQFQTRTVSGGASFTQTIDELWCCTKRGLQIFVPERFHIHILRIS